MFPYHFSADVASLIEGSPKLARTFYFEIDKNGEGHCYTPMGCRSFLTPYVDENNKPKYYGRFNQGKH